MDLLNRTFYKLLMKHDIFLNREELFDQYRYTGKIAIDDNNCVLFTVSLSKGDEQGIIQIVYKDLYRCINHNDYNLWLEKINRLNLKNGIYYYFCISDNGDVYMRYASEVTPTQLIHEIDILKKGALILRSLWSSIFE